MIHPVCAICEQELTEPGAILLSPPDRKGKIKKYHICKKDFKRLKSMVK
jgi:hypothetical protein